MPESNLTRSIVTAFLCTLFGSVYIDGLVDTGIYSSRSDVVRDAVRRLVLNNLIGIIPNTGDSVKEMRGIKKKLSKEIKSFKDIEEINKLID